MERHGDDMKSSQNRLNQNDLDTHKKKGRIPSEKTRQKIISERLPYKNRVSSGLDKKAKIIT